jgi:glutamate racemase
VPLAEEGWVDNDVARQAARAYLEDPGGDGVDTLMPGRIERLELVDLAE